MALPNGRNGSEPADVCLVLEGTYPYVKGGVSTWVHDLIGDLKGRGRRVDEDGECLHARRLVLADHQLAMPGARPPVNPAQGVAGPVLPNPEQLVAGAGPRRRQTRLQLVWLAPHGQRCEAREDERNLRIGVWPATCEEAEGVARADSPARGADRPATKFAHDFHAPPALLRHKTRAELDPPAVELPFDPRGPAG